MTDYKPIMTQATDHDGNSFPFVLILSLMFFGDDQACVARVVHLNETRGSKLVISGSLWIFFFLNQKLNLKKKI